MRPGVLLVAKAPVAGLAKTRLIEAVGARGAADIAAAALLDTIDTCEQVFPVGHRLAALTGDLDSAERAPELISRLTHWRTFAQRGNGFAARLANAHADAAKLLGRPVVQIGMDTPQLSPGQLADVVKLVMRPSVDAVLGPAVDGGWWALGLADPWLAAGLSEVSMSTDETADETEAMLVRARAAVVRTATVRDVDTPVDAAAVAGAFPTSRFAHAWRGWSERPLSPAEAFDVALAGRACLVHGLPGGPKRLPVDRWQEAGTAADRALLTACSGATLDVGCGPGRLTLGLAERGLPALGIDIATTAVRQTVARGGQAIRRDVFDVVPGEGRWESVLLADGNIGIGGDPVRLLRRASDLLSNTGRAVVEVAAPGSGARTHQVHLEVDGRRSTSFPWATVAADRLEALAEQAALRMLWMAEERGRWFALLGKGATRS